MDKEKSQVLLLDFLDDYFIFQRYFFTLTFESTYATLDQAERQKIRKNIWGRFTLHELCGIINHIRKMSVLWSQKGE